MWNLKIFAFPRGGRFPPDVQDIIQWKDHLKYDLLDNGWGLPQRDTVVLLVHGLAHR